MIAIIKGDIVASRQIKNPEKWIIPLKELFNQWGTTPETWELVWGDFFQVEIPNAEEALLKALQIKALIKKIESSDASKNSSTIDVRMSIGLGQKNYIANAVSESNGEAFINAGEKFDTLKKEKTHLAVQSNDEWFNREFNLYFKLLNTIIDNWSINSAELVSIVLSNPHATQKEIGEILGIKQHSVSGRWNRAKLEEVREVEKMFRKKLKTLYI